MKYKKIFNLNNKVAVITGATGMLGKEFCLALAEYGCKIAVIDLDLKKVMSFSDRLSKKYDIKTVGIKCDVRDHKEVKKMAIEVEKKLGGIDILVNNAASKTNSLDEYFKPLEKYNIDTWKEVMDVNLNGMYIVAKEIGTRMAKRKKGSIIQTSSIYSSTMASDQRIYKGSKYLNTTINTPAAYSVSKAGVVGLSLHLASYWAKDKVRVNILSPGGVFSGQNKKFVENYSKRVPLNRMANKEEMVGAILYLASDASSYVTGQNIFVDGGLSIW
jgi:NAD(P)-dependent dehydrogenase (short-subunit alcohol dehydrogenase family)